MATRKWNIDTSHSNVGFTARHMMMLKVHGRFQKWSGSFEMDDADPTQSKVTVTIDAGSIDTNDAKRDGHLKSADFFDVEKNPTIEFKSTKVKDLGGGKMDITGNLSMHGVTKEVVLHAEAAGKGKDPWGNERVAFEGKTTVDRTEFGLKWNQALEAGGVLVSEKIGIEIDVQAIPG